MTRSLDPVDMVLLWAKRCALYQEAIGSDCDSCVHRARCQKAADVLIGRLYTSRATSRIRHGRKN